LVGFGIEKWKSWLVNLAELETQLYSGHHFNC